METKTILSNMWQRLSKIGFLYVYTFVFQDFESVLYWLSEFLHTVFANVQQMTNSKSYGHESAIVPR